MDLKVILSTVFIFLGSTVFYISSLVSGHNIYRDLSTNLSTLVTSLVGVLLFIFSPLSFVVIFPQLFQLSVDPSDARAFVTNLHKVIFESILWPYFAAAVGFGLIFGCLTAIKFRRMVLRYIKKKTGLRYRIFSYGFTWDDLLMRVKQNGEITVRTREKTLIGNLHAYSVRDEPKQIVLKGYRVLNDDKKANIGVINDGEILLTEVSNIEEVAVPSKSMNMHTDSISHSTQAFYIAFTAIGFLCLSFSFHATNEFLVHYKFFDLAYIYLCLFVITQLSAWAFIVGSIVLCRKDFSNLMVAMVLFPINLFIATAASLAAVLLAVHVGDSGYTISCRVFAIAAAVLAPLIFLVVHRCAKVRALFTEIYESKSWESKSELASLVSYICQEADLSADPQELKQDLKSLTKLKLKLLSEDHRHAKALEKLTTFIRNFLDDKRNSFLQNDIWNLMLRLKWFIDRRN